MVDCQLAMIGYPVESTKGLYVGIVESASQNLKVVKHIQ